MIHDTVTVYHADSIRASNGSQDGMPIFGRFAAIVRTDSYRLIESDDGWYIACPNGCTLWSGDGSEQDARSAWARIRERFPDGEKHRGGWTTSADNARRNAILMAAARHNAKVCESCSYKAKFGDQVTIGS